MVKVKNKLQKIKKISNNNINGRIILKMNNAMRRKEITVKNKLLKIVRH
jgi:hypothetical protein